MRRAAWAVLASVAGPRWLCQAGSVGHSSFPSLDPGGCLRLPAGMTAWAIQMVQAAVVRTRPH